MTISDLNELGKYIADKTKKETTFFVSDGKIENPDFKYILLLSNYCSIKHIRDKSLRENKYKTLINAKKYIDKWLDANKC